MPMRPLVGRGYAPDTRAVSEAVAPMVNACDPRTKVRTKSRRGRSPDLRDPSPPFAMPMRPLVGRGYAPDTRAVSEAVAPMVNACDPRTKVRTKSRRGRSPDLRDPSPPFAMHMRQPDEIGRAHV